MKHMRKYYLLLICLVFSTWAHADTLQWQTPIGLINLNLATTEAVTGYDAVLKQAIAGLAVPVYTSPGDYVTLKVGADAPWQTNGKTVEPLVLAGHNIFGDIPAMDAYPNAQLNVFGRWAAESGKAGAGIAFSYSFGGVPTTNP